MSTYATPSSAVASSEFSGSFTAAKAIDASTSSYWLSTNYDAGTNIYFDLGKLKYVDKIKVWIGASTISEVFDVQFSANATDWTTVESDCSIGSYDQWVEKIITTPGNARYVKFAMKSSGNGTRYSITEVLIASTTLGYLASGTAICHPIDISALSTSLVMKWTHTTPANTTITVETAVNTTHDVAPVTWTAQTNGATVSTIPEGSLSGKYLWVKITLETIDEAVTPEISRIWFE